MPPGAAKDGAVKDGAAPLEWPGATCDNLGPVLHCFLFAITLSLMWSHFLYED